MKFLQKLTPWLIGAAMTTALFIVLSRISYFRFENSDDILIVKSFMGFEGNTPLQFHLYAHTLLVWLMNALGSLMPNVAWFSVFLLALIWLSGTVLVKSMVQIARNHRLSWSVGALMGGLFLLVFFAFSACRVTYTTTAALAGAAAVAQFLSINQETVTKKQLLSAFLLSLLLLVCTYCLRQITVLPPLAFFGLAVAWRLVARHSVKCEGQYSPKPIFHCLLVLILVFGVLVGLRASDIAACNQQSFLDWHQARVRLFDYKPFEQDLAPALTADSGMSESELILLQEWYFMDEKATIEAFDVLSAAYENVPSQSPLQRLGNFFSENIRYQLSAVFLLALLMVCLLCVRKGKSAWTALVALLAVLGTCVLLLYLCQQGRVLSRAMDSVFFPCGALLCCATLTALSNLHDVKPVRRAAVLAVCVICMLCAGANVLATKKVLSDHPDTVSAQREAELESYALQNPDMLLVRTPNLLRDTRLFPDVSAGIPTNIIIWGDWYCRTLSWNAQLMRFGFDAAAFTASDWLAANIVFATQEEAPPEALVRYISEGVGTSVTAKQIGENGSLRFFHFVLAAQASMSQE